jgi:hypothetical protein
MLGSSRLAISDRTDPASVRRDGMALARSAGIPAAQLDQMLWLYCARGYGGTCGAIPRCSECHLRSRCVNGKSGKLTMHGRKPASPKQRANRKSYVQKV